VNGIVNPKGARYAKVVAVSDQTFDIAFYGAQADFAAITGAAKIIDASRTSLAGTTGTAGVCIYVECSGWRYFCPVMTNKSGAAAAAMSWSVQFFDA
jgi:hypothetical protein